MYQGNFYDEDISALSSIYCIRHIFGWGGRGAVITKNTAAHKNSLAMFLLASMKLQTNFGNPFRNLLQDSTAAILAL